MRLPRQEPPKVYDSTASSGCWRLLSGVCQPVSYLLLRSLSLHKGGLGTLGLGHLPWATMTQKEVPQINRPQLRSNTPHHFVVPQTLAGCKETAQTRLLAAGSLLWVDICSYGEMFAKGPPNSPQPTKQTPSMCSQRPSCGDFAVDLWLESKAPRLLDTEHGLF